MHMYIPTAYLRYSVSILCGENHQHRTRVDRTPGIQPSLSQEQKEIVMDQISSFSLFCMKTITRYASTTTEH